MAAKLAASQVRETRLIKWIRTLALFPLLSNLLSSYSACQALSVEVVATIVVAESTPAPYQPSFPLPSPSLPALAQGEDRALLSPPVNPLSGSSPQLPFYVSSSLPLSLSLPTYSGEYPFCSFSQAVLCCAEPRFASSILSAETAAATFSAEI